MSSLAAKLLALSSLAFSTCAMAEMPGRDGYYFEQTGAANLTPQITFVVHPNVKALRLAMPASAQAVEGRMIKVRAWSELKDGRCVVHIIDPSVLYIPEMIGHEVAHCIYGKFHP